MATYPCLVWSPKLQGEDQYYQDYHACQAAHSTMMRLQTVSLTQTIILPSKYGWFRFPLAILDWRCPPSPPLRCSALRLCYIIYTYLHQGLSRLRPFYFLSTSSLVLVIISRYCFSAALIALESGVVAVTGHRS